MWVCVGPAAHLTMQSCMILFQSSPVTIRKRTVIALPAVEKLACLRLEETDRMRQLHQDVFYCDSCIQPAVIISRNKQQSLINKQKRWSLPVNVLSVFDSSKENYASKSVTEEKEEHAHDDEEALVHADNHSQQQHLQSYLYSQTDTHDMTDIIQMYILYLQYILFGKIYKNVQKP